MDLTTLASNSDEYYYHKKFDFKHKNMAIHKLEGRKRLLSNASETSYASTTESECDVKPMAKRFKLEDHEANDSGISDSSTTPPPPSYLAIEKVPASIVSQMKELGQETADRLCMYHGSMVRRFPPKKRAPKDQERRDKNTIACRFSRCRKKLQHAVIEKKYQEFSHHYQQVMEEILISSFYMQHLINLSEETKKKKSFTISYLLTGK